MTGNHVKTGEEPNTKMSYTRPTPQTMTNIRLGPLADIFVNSVESCVGLKKSEICKN